MQHQQNVQIKYLHNSVTESLQFYSAQKSDKYNSTWVL